MSNRAKTVEEARNEFMFAVRNMAYYWSSQEGVSELDRCDGVAIGILNILDGVSMSLPAFDLVLVPHESDKADSVLHGNDWYESGMVINGDCMLHELYYGGKKS